MVLYWSVGWFRKTKWLNFTFTLFNLSLIFTLVVLAYEADDRERDTHRKVAGEFNEDTERFFTDIENKFLTPPFPLTFVQEGRVGQEFVLNVGEEALSCLR